MESTDGSRQVWLRPAVKLPETKLAVLRIDQEMKTEVAEGLRVNQAKQAELVARRIAAEDQLWRAEIGAPQADIVHQLAVHTVGGVINPSEPVMLIVPGNDRLVIEAKVAPRDIDQVLPCAGGICAFRRLQPTNHA